MRVGWSGARRRLRQYLHQSIPTKMMATKMIHDRMPFVADKPTICRGVKGLGNDGGSAGGGGEGGGGEGAVTTTRRIVG